jgi:hypothetical protein
MAFVGVGLRSSPLKKDLTKEWEGCGLPGDDMEDWKPRPKNGQIIVQKVRDLLRIVIKRESPTLESSCFLRVTGL